LRFSSRGAAAALGRVRNLATAIGSLGRAAGALSLGVLDQEQGAVGVNSDPYWPGGCAHR